MTGNYNEYQVISSYNKTKRQIFCHTKDPKTLFMVMYISQVNEDAGLWNVGGNIKFNGLNLQLNKLVTLSSGLPTKPFDLVKKILGGSVKTLTGTPAMFSTSPYEPMPDYPTGVSKEDGWAEENCDKYSLYFPNAENDTSLKTVSGGYSGTAFEENGNNAVVPASLKINGLEKELDASFVFKSVRYESGLFEETLKILTSSGDLIAEALYKDEGDSILSTVPYALYSVHTSTGEIRDMKGQYIKIEFDNEKPCKPRTVSLVLGFGPDAKNANILPNKVKIPKLSYVSMKAFTKESDTIAMYGHSINCCE